MFPSTSPDGYAASIEEYYEAMETLFGTLLSAMAVGLELPPDWFDDKIDHHISALRTLNYPNQIKVPEPGQLRAGAHTDYGIVTILRSGGPGLQVAKEKDNPSWVDVPSVDNSFIINLGKNNLEGGGEKKKVGRYRRGTLAEVGLGDISTVRFALIG